MTKFVYTKRQLSPQNMVGGFEVRYLMVFSDGNVLAMQ